ncbi:MAG: GNAT family N-acetyltransferase [Gammaproteobacteria bacterium]|nr:GNAT family N-acetyltransferase [Gammaproteobacteria bacterium]
MENAIIPIDVWRADWSYDRETISAIRRRVFIEEQQVPEDMEWDGLDAGAIHVLGGFTGQTSCATGRLLGSGQIGRMVVLPASRGHGLGGLLLATLIRAAGDSGLPRVFLHAQVRAVPFYLRHGFELNGEKFEEAGILHRPMARNIPRHMP